MFFFFPFRKNHFIYALCFYIHFLCTCPTLIYAIIDIIFFLFISYLVDKNKRKTSEIQHNKIINLFVLLLMNENVEFQLSLYQKLISQNMTY